jgi:hypothetical protein
MDHILQKIQQLPIFKLFFNKIESLILLGIFFLAIYLRLNIDPRIPFHYDPGKNIVYARAALDWFPLVPLTNQYFNLGEYFEYQVLFPYLTALFHIMSGLPLEVIVTWIAIVSGSALTISVYFLTKEIFQNITAAIISAFFIAVSNIQILQYMNYYPQILATTLIPISFIFLVRYIKTHHWNHLIIVIFLSVLIGLCSYLSILIYFAIILVSLGVWSIFDRHSLYALILVPLLSMCMSAFFWLPIISRHGLDSVISNATGYIFFMNASPFTNKPWTLTTLFTYSSSIVIAIFGAFIVILLFKKINWNFSKILLSIWILISLILVSSYLFHPILWIDRFYPFLDIAVIICTGEILNLIASKINTIPVVPKKTGYMLVLLLLISVLVTINLNVVFSSWGYPSDFSMVNYMEKNIEPGSLVLAPSGIQGFFLSGLSGTRILGGESAQMLDVKYDGFEDTNNIINSPDVEEKMNLIRKYGINYIVLPIHQNIPTIWNPSYRIAGINAFNNETYFKVVISYHDSWGVTELLKVNENLQPNYNPLPINWEITIIGYIVSILSFIGVLLVPRIKNPRLQTIIT